MVEIIPSARVQVRETHQLRSPGTCALCGNGTCVDGYIDPDVYFEWEGNIYFCMNCAKQMAKAIGCLLPDESRYLEELNNTIAEDLKETKEKLRAYDGLINAITGALGSDVADISRTLDSILGKGEPEQPDNGTDAPSATDAGKPEVTEPVAKQGPVHPKRPQRSNEPRVNI